MTSNRLGSEISPYLLQHKDNPVWWYPWGEDAFAAAREADKPILLSVGYAACHWCHVMAHESFENTDIAAVMNDLFINIKVDREERPDIDAIYQSALALLGQHGGWPLTMFLTPQGKPFWGGTYFPAEAKYGRAAFPDILKAVADAYVQQREKVDRSVTSIEWALNNMSANQGGPVLSDAFTVDAARKLAKHVDPVHGGLGGAPKFPQPRLLELFWRGWIASGDEALRDAVVHTLTRMCQGGIYDHVGGGFARYTVDEAWLVPHFEKMLYDNAQLLDILAQVSHDTGNLLFQQRVAETIDWMDREMTAGTAGFASSLDADSEGEEGRFYVWTRDDIDECLGPDADLFCDVYDVRNEGNWEGKSILNRLYHPELFDHATEARLADARARLAERRATRVRPGWDDKVMADWNGLAIHGLVTAGFLQDRPDWIDRAERCFAFVVDVLSTDDDGLYHAWRDGQTRGQGTLDDYVAMARAGIALYEVTGKHAYLARSQAWIARVERGFLDAKRGGYYLTETGVPDVIVRTKTVYDNAIASGNGQLLETLVRLFHHTGIPVYQKRSDALLRAFSGEPGRNLQPLGSYLCGVDLMHRATHVTIAGNPESSEFSSLVNALRSHMTMNTLPLILAGDADLAEDHPGKTLADSRDVPAIALVCRHQTCLPPISDPKALAEALTASNADQL